MIDYIDSPVPFIIGVEESVWNKVFMKKWPELSDDTVCFDLETELLNSKIDMPSPPEPMNSMIQSTLTEIISRHHSLTER